MQSISFAILILVGLAAYVCQGTPQVFLKNYELVLDDVNGHYEDPYTGPCGSDEVNITIQDVPGAFCTTKCSAFKKCPTDVPQGMTAQPQCCLQSSDNKKFCGVICDPNGDDDQCGDHASCKPISGVGICTYDN